MPSHWAFGHLLPKLWAKEGPGVKLAVWLPTTKSRESTSSRSSNLKCDTSLERSRQGSTSSVQTSSRSDLAVGSYELPKSRDSTRDDFGTTSGLHFGSPRNLCHLDVAPTGRSRVYYREYGGGILPNPGRGESCGPKCPWLVPTPKGVLECELTTRVVCFVEILAWSTKSSS
jgi:hypothetical protein